MKIFSSLKQVVRKNKKIFLALAIFSVIFSVGLIFLTNTANAQSLTVDLADNTGSTTGRIVNMVLLLTVLSLAPSILIMTTSFTRLVIVFSIVRSALATNTTPPNMVMVSLALFLTSFIMMPTFEQSWEQGIKPLVEEKVEMVEGLNLAMQPIKKFMLNNTRDKDLNLFMNLSNTDKVEKMEDVPLKVAIPSFMISELRRAFEIGFLIYVPFLIIDMIIASVLMSMGMMMLPPTMLAMPFKLIFFVLVDGWYLLCGSLVKSFTSG